MSNEIPNVQSDADWQQHHMRIFSKDGKVNLNIWRDDGCLQIHYGPAYGRAMKNLGGEKLGGGSGWGWQLVVSKGGSLSLYDSAGWNDCPQNCNNIQKHTGSWVPIKSTSAQKQITTSIGITRSYTNTDTQTWSNSVTIAVSKGFSAMGETQSESVSNTTSETISRMYSSTFSQTTTTQYTDGPFPPGTIWQWQWSTSHWLRIATTGPGGDATPAFAESLGSACATRHWSPSTSSSTTIRGNALRGTHQNGDRCRSY